MGWCKQKRDIKVNMRALPEEDSQMVIQIPTEAEVVVLRYGEEAQLKAGEQQLIFYCTIIVLAALAPLALDT